MKTFEIEIKKVISVTQEDIDDIMCSALEGGITYWCYEADVLGEYLGEYASEQISRGGKLKLYLWEEVNGETKYWLTLDKFLKGIQKWYEDGCDEYGAVQPDGTLDCCEIDSAMADLIIQFALFDEIVFG